MRNKQHISYTGCYHCPVNLGAWALKFPQSQRGVYMETCIVSYTCVFLKYFTEIVIPSSVEVAFRCVRGGVKKFDDCFHIYTTVIVLPTGYFPNKNQTK